MKKVLVFLILFNIFLVSCSTNETTNNYEGLTPEMRATSLQLDKMFENGGKYRCEYIYEDGGAYTKQTLYIDGQNFRAKGFNHPKSWESYNVRGNITSEVLGIVNGEGYCTYMWSMSESNRGTKLDKGVRSCSKTKPNKPFSVNDLMSGAFLGITPELIDECMGYYGKIDLTVPENREFFDMTRLEGSDNPLQVENQ